MGTLPEVLQAFYFRFREPYRTCLVFFSQVYCFTIIHHPVASYFLLSLQSLCFQDKFIFLSLGSQPHTS